MLTLATKASMLSRWDALVHAKGAFMVMGVGCLATLALFFWEWSVSSLPVSPFLPTWIASSLSISSTLVRFYLVKRGWSAVSMRELGCLNSHWMSSGDDQPGLDTPGFGLPDQIQAHLLRIAQEQGFVSWAQVNHALKSDTSPRDIQWMFIGRGGEPVATFAAWSGFCSPAAQLDANSPLVSRETQARRL